jgi:hypothetical protein
MPIISLLLGVLLVSTIAPTSAGLLSPSAEPGAAWGQNLFTSSRAELPPDEEADTEVEADDAHIDDDSAIELPAPEPKKPSL